MSSFSDRVYESLYITEGFVPTIYKDSEGIPTIGVGYALLVKGCLLYTSDAADE